MTVTLLTSQSAPTTTNADALVTGVFQGQDGPVLAPITGEIDLMAALTALGATGKAEEITKIPTSGRLAVPVIVGQVNIARKQVNVVNAAGHGGSPLTAAVAG